MPDHSVETYSWSGWATTLPVGLPILAGSLMAAVPGLVVNITGAMQPRVSLGITGLGLLILGVVTVLLFREDPGIPRSWPRPQVSVGLLLTYLGYAISIRSCFLLSVRPAGNQRLSTAHPGQ